MNKTFFHTRVFYAHNGRDGPDRHSGQPVTFFVMSKKNSDKKLLGVYRRCLSTLNQNFKLHPVTVEEEKQIAKQAVEDASEFEAAELSEGRKAFANKGAKDKWIAERTYRLWQYNLGKHFNDPLRTAKEHIQTLADSVSSL